MSSRLFQEIREKRGLVYSIYSFAHPFQDGGLFAVYAGTGEKEAEELVPVTVEELRKVQTDVTQDELDRAKAQFRASLLMSMESTGSRTEQLARQIQVHGRIIPVEETKAKHRRGHHRGGAGSRPRRLPRAADAGGARPGRQGARPGRDRRPAGGLSRARVSEPRPCTPARPGHRCPCGVRSGHCAHDE